MSKIISSILFIFVSLSKISCLSESLSTECFLSFFDAIHPSYIYKDILILEIFEIFKFEIFDNVTSPVIGSDIKKSFF